MKLIWRKSNREREQEKLLAEKAYAANVACNAAMTQPSRRPCDIDGHHYLQVDKSRKSVLFVCTRCADSVRIPLHFAPGSSSPSLRPQRYADLA